MARHAASLALLGALLAAPLAQAAPPTEPSLRHAAPLVLNARPADDAKAIERGLARAVEAKRLTKSQAAHYRAILEEHARRPARLAGHTEGDARASAFARPASGRRVHEAARPRAVLDARGERRLPEGAPAAGERNRRRRRRRGRLSRRLGLRAPVPSARERRPPERPRRRRADQAGKGARRRACSPARFRAARARCGSTTSRTAAARRPGRPGWRRPSARRRSPGPGATARLATRSARSRGRSSCVSAPARGSSTTASATWSS